MANDSLDHALANPYASGCANPPSPFAWVQLRLDHERTIFCDRRDVFPSAECHVDNQARHVRAIQSIRLSKTEAERDAIDSYSMAYWRETTWTILIDAQQALTIAMAIPTDKVTDTDVQRLDAMMDYVVRMAKCANTHCTLSWGGDADNITTLYGFMEIPIPFTLRALIPSFFWRETDEMPAFKNLHITGGAPEKTA